MADYEKEFDIAIPDVSIEDLAELGLDTIQIAIPGVGIEPDQAIYLEEPINACFLYDASGPSFTDYSNEANSETNNDVPLLPNPVGAGDGLYIGSFNKPNWVLIRIGTAGVGTYTIQFLYYNGADWVAMPFVYDSIGNYKATGHGRFFFLIPDDMAEATVNGEYMYWIFAKYVSGTLTTQPLGDRIWMNYYQYLPVYIRPTWTGVAAGVME